MRADTGPQVQEQIAFIELGADWYGLSVDHGILVGPTRSQTSSFEHRDQAGNNSSERTQSGWAMLGGPKWDCAASSPEGRSGMAW